MRVRRLKLKLRNILRILSKSVYFVITLGRGDIHWRMDELSGGGLRLLFSGKQVLGVSLEEVLSVETELSLRLLEADEAVLRGLEGPESFDLSFEEFGPGGLKDPHLRLLLGPRRERTLVVYQLLELKGGELIFRGLFPYWSLGNSLLDLHGVHLLRGVIWTQSEGGSSIVEAKVVFLGSEKGLPSTKFAKSQSFLRPSWRRPCGTLWDALLLSFC